MMMIMMIMMINDVDDDSFQSYVVVFRRQSVTMI